MMDREPYWATVILIRENGGVLVRDDFNEIRFVADPPPSIKVGSKIDLMKYASGPTNQLGAMLGLDG